MSETESLSQAPSVSQVSAKLLRAPTHPVSHCCSPPFLHLLYNYPSIKIIIISNKIIRQQRRRRLLDRRRMQRRHHLRLTPLPPPRDLSDLPQAHADQQLPTHHRLGHVGHRPLPAPPAHGPLAAAATAAGL